MLLTIKKRTCGQTVLLVSATCIVFPYIMYIFMYTRFVVNSSVLTLRKRAQDSGYAHTNVKRLITPIEQTRSNQISKEVNMLQILTTGAVPLIQGLVRLDDGLVCNISKDMSWFNNSHVVIVNMGRELPPMRCEGQRWVGATRESPFHVLPTAYNAIVNHTMTYSPHSDIPVPYGVCSPIAGGHASTSYSVNMASGRKHLVAWFVSNCDGQSGRRLYARKLQQYIPVHIYGKCGTYECPDDDTAVLDLLRDNYKFYIAFENSLCHSYMTEKVFRAYEAEVVPVVMGALDYSENLADGSYLHVADYENPEALARHMMELDANDTLYNEMFNWRTKYSCGVTNKHVMTEKTCLFLHQTNNIGPHVTTFGKHWNITEQCLEKHEKLSYLRQIGLTNITNYSGVFP